MSSTYGSNQIIGLKCEIMSKRSLTKKNVFFIKKKNNIMISKQVFSKLCTKSVLTKFTYVFFRVFKKTRAQTAPAMAIQSVIFSLFQPIPAIWSYLELFGFFGSYLEILRAIQSYRELFGVIWSHLVPFGAIWS